MSQLRRREFLTLFGGAAAWPIGAGAERDGDEDPTHRNYGRLAPMEFIPGSSA